KWNTHEMTSCMNAQQFSPKLASCLGAPDEMQVAHPQKKTTARKRAVVFSSFSEITYVPPPTA
ncbi:hypothetical protein, partial [Pseudomonas sp. PS02285]|uniref:hypothetical protein n=1 Tax=Pseudomonas sp. PS02285 TaxID=2991441 RepID=UPI00249AC745